MFLTTSKSRRNFFTIPLDNYVQNERGLYRLHSQFSLLQYPVLNAKKQGAEILRLDSDTPENPLISMFS